MLSTSRLLGILVLGVFGSLLGYLIVLTLVARILSLTILNVVDQYSALLLIIGIEFLLLIGVSYVISLALVNKSLRDIVPISFGYSILFSLAILTSFCYLALCIFQTELFFNLGIINLAAFPLIIVYTGIYVMPHPNYLIIFMVIMYYLVYTVVLDYMSDVHLQKYYELYKDPMSGY